jgi:sialate O-acetylesterase
MKLWLFPFLILFSGVASANVTVSPLFSDHGVLQRGRPIPVWGTAKPGEAVRVELGRQTAQTTADARGSWRVRLASMTAGGPYEMKITGSNRIVLHDLLIGEVWLASGQSNMEIGLSIVSNAALELSAANHPKLRIFTVARQPVADPASSLSGNWVVSTPETAKMFSGIPYLFGSILQADLKVPVGIINSSVGNTPAEAWTPLAELKADPLLAPGAIQQNEDLRKFVSVEQVRGELEGWEKQYGAQDRGNAGFAQGFSSGPMTPQDWSTITLPTTGAALGIKGAAAIWVRREITLPERRYDKAANLDLGPMRESDTTYFDGVEIGKAPPDPIPFDRNILYQVPATLLHPGTHTISVRVFSHQPPRLYLGSRLSAFIVLDSETAKDGFRIPLPGEWKYRKEFESGPMSDVAMKSEPVLTMHAIAVASALYNGMIYPLQDYALRGVIWYQGENNASHAPAYQNLLTRMITSWRRQFEQPGLPFFLVQLPNYGGGRSGWDALRASQEALTKSLHDTALAIAIDAGEEDNIHPRNKRPVAERLALLARHRVYGENVEDTGPTYTGMTVEQDKIRIRLSHAQGLKATSPVIPNFAIAGDDRKFYPATATINGAAIIVSAPQVLHPVAVRYAHSQDPEGCNVYNGANLPLAPFLTDDWNMPKTPAR